MKSIRYENIETRDLLMLLQRLLKIEYFVHHFKTWTGVTKPLPSTRRNTFTCVRPSSDSPKDLAYKRHENLTSYP